MGLRTAQSQTAVYNLHANLKTSCCAALKSDFLKSWWRSCSRAMSTCFILTALATESQPTVYSVHTVPCSRLRPWDVSLHYWCSCSWRSMWLCRRILSRRDRWCHQLNQSEPAILPVQSSPLFSAHDAAAAEKNGITQITVLCNVLNKNKTEQ